MIKQIVPKENLTNDKQLTADREAFTYYKIHLAILLYESDVLNIHNVK